MAARNTSKVESETVSTNVNDRKWQRQNYANTSVCVKAVDGLPDLEVLGTKLADLQVKLGRQQCQVSGTPRAVYGPADPITRRGTILAFQYAVTAYDIVAVA